MTEMMKEIMPQPMPEIMPVTTSNPPPEKHIRGRKNEASPNPVDVHVGNRMRLRRTLLGFSQQYLARKIGVTFQQIQKYEKGWNRIGASRLWNISKVLGVSMDFFFEDMKKDVENQSPMMLSLTDDEGYCLQQEDFDYGRDVMKREETLELVRNYYHIMNRKLAKMIFDMIETISKSNSTMNIDD